MFIIDQISSNLVPFDIRPTSIVATSALIVSVAAAVLIGVAFALHWGMPAIYSLAPASGVALLIALAIILCKKRSKNTPDLSKAFRDVFPQANNNEDQSQISSDDRAVRQLYSLYIKDDIATFKKALKLFNPQDLDSVCVHSHAIKLDQADQTTTLDKGNEQLRGGHSLFHIILGEKDESKKLMFLKALLEGLKDHYVTEHQERFLLEFLDMQDADIIDLLFRKLDQATIGKMFEMALDPKKECKLSWLESFFARWPKDEKLRSARKDLIYEKLMKAKLSTDLKLKYLKTIADFKHKSLEDMEIECSKLTKMSFGCRFHNQTLLHMAIDAEDIELVKEFASKKSLVNKPTIIEKKYWLTPLHRAIINGNLEIVNILLAAKADPNYGVDPHWFFDKPRNNAVYVTPLMMAANMGREDIVEALLNAGANKDIKDGKDKHACTVQEYLEDYKSKNPSK